MVGANSPSTLAPLLFPAPQSQHAVLRAPAQPPPIIPLHPLCVMAPRCSQQQPGFVTAVVFWTLHWDGAPLQQRVGALEGAASFGKYHVQLTPAGCSLLILFRVHYRNPELYLNYKSNNTTLSLAKLFAFLALCSDGLYLIKCSFLCAHLRSSPRCRQLAGQQGAVGWDQYLARRDGQLLELLSFRT